MKLKFVWQQGRKVAELRKLLTTNIDIWHIHYTYIRTHTQADYGSIFCRPVVTLLTEIVIIVNTGVPTCYALKEHYMFTYMSTHTPNKTTSSQFSASIFRSWWRTKLFAHYNYCYMVGSAKRIRGNFLREKLNRSDVGS